MKRSNQPLNRMRAPASGTLGAMKHSLRLLCVSLLLLQVGCASVYGTFTEPEVYIGTKQDAQTIGGIIADADASAGIHGGIFGLFMLPFFLIDLPLSFGADTLFLPYTIFKHNDKTTEEKK